MASSRGINDLDGGGDQDESLKQELDKLWMVCNVLGILYETKLAEFGPETGVTEERVREVVKFLTDSRDANFTRLKESVERLARTWETCNTSMARVGTFSWVFFIKEAEKADQISHWHLLSNESVQSVEEEICKLISDRAVKIKKKYTMLKSKLKGLLLETHLTPQDIHFDMNEQAKVDRYEYRRQKGDLKDAIKDVKKLRDKRRDLLVRMEMARKAVRNKKRSSDDKNTYISYAEKTAAKMKNDDNEEIPYDGATVDGVLKALRVQANERVTVEVVDSEDEEVPVVQTVLSRTRSGRHR